MRKQDVAAAAEGGGARIELELVESRIAPNRDAPISPNRAETRGAR